MIRGFFRATTMPDADWWQTLWPDPARVVAAMGVGPGMVAVDLCCGDGLFTAALAAVATRVWAIDIDREMLQRARAKVAAAAASDCRFIAADAMRLAAVVREPVDYVFLANTFHGVSDRPGLARSVAMVLRPAGRFGIINWHRRLRDQTVVLGQPRGPATALRLAPGDVSAAVQPAGLRLQRTLELPPYHYGIVFAKGGGDE
jgi:ubiquinone/menaquinone biosynthesis C-methylase UbiE